MLFFLLGKLNILFLFWAVIFLLYFPPPRIYLSCYISLFPKFGGRAHLLNRLAVTPRPHTPKYDGHANTLPA